MPIPRNESIPKAPWIYLPVESATREWSPRLLVACCAAERGYTAVIGKKKELADKYTFLPRGMIVDKSLATVRDRQFRKLRAKGYRISASEEESLWAYREPDQFAAMRVSDSNLTIADHYFAWGEEQARIVRERCPNASEKIRTVGSPRFDILREEFRSLYSESQNILSKYGRFILIPSNFASIIYDRGGREAYLEMRKRHGGIPSVAEETRMNAILDHKERNLNLYVDALPKIADAFPLHTIILRPHPSDNVTFWRQVTDGVENARVVGGGSVIPWLIAAEGMFHHGCTTALEAYILGKSPIAYHPSYDPQWDNELPSMMGPIVEDEAGLIRLLKRSMGGQPVGGRDREWINRFVEVDHKRLSADRIVDAVDDVELKERRLDSVGLQARWACVCIRDALLRRRRLPERPWKFREKGPNGGSETEWGSKTGNSVEGEVERFRASSGRFCNVKVKQIGTDLFAVYQEGAHPVGRT